MSLIRRRLLKAGTIEFGGGVIDCTVRNLSEFGAALDVVSPVGIPKTRTSPRRPLRTKDHMYILEQLAKLFAHKR